VAVAAERNGRGVPACDGGVFFLDFGYTGAVAKPWRELQQGIDIENNWRELQLGGSCNWD
jgi:hypothetical protein